MMSQTPRHTAPGGTALPADIQPPRSEDEAIRWLQLMRSRRVGPSTFFRLMTTHGNAANALLALPEIARQAGVEGYRSCDPLDAEREYRAGQRLGARLLCFGTSEYPDAFLTLKSAPPILWCHGDAGFLSRRKLALVGARNASSLGTRMARGMAQELGAAGFTIVSGLARGVDTAAHIAAMDTGTIAVMAGGVDTVYPSENASLARQISENGLLISEQPLGLYPQARHFPSRNRLVSGLSEGVVVVEAAAKSGSLITARTALDQGREVMAVPGHPLDARAGGCNLLIRDGSVLVRSADDVIEALSPIHAATAEAAGVRQSPPPSEPPPVPAADELEERILALLGTSPVAEDQILRDLGLPAQAVAGRILNLELCGRVERQAGSLLCRVAG